MASQLINFKGELPWPDKYGPLTVWAVKNIAALKHCDLLEYPESLTRLIRETVKDKKS